jgi:hypothetical protein
MRFKKPQIFSQLKRGISCQVGTGSALACHGKLRVRIRTSLSKIINGPNKQKSGKVFLTRQETKNKHGPDANFIHFLARK